MSAIPRLTPEQVASADFAAYVAAQYPEYTFNTHHMRMVDALERVSRGEVRRLMVFMPPRHGKSMLCSEYFPAWHLGRNPHQSIIAASYSAELAEDFGRRVRNQMGGELWRAVFPNAGLDTRSASAARLSMMQGGGYMAVGVGGSVTGRGAHVLLIDDPVKGREEADSPTMQRRVKEWYRAVAYTRLMKGGAIVLIMTRWHENDLAGWLLEEHGHEGWEVLSFPALAGEGDALGRGKGDALWPEFFPVERLEAIRKTVGPREWSALYQQTPAPDEGAYFRREWLKFYDPANMPENVRYYGASDYAVSDGDGDYTVHIVAGVDSDDNLYLVDVWRGQTDALEWVEAFLAMLRAWKPAVWAEEGGVILKSIDPIIRKRLAEERLFTTYRKPFTSAVDKPTRARSLQARMQMGKVFFPHFESVPWMHDLYGELLTFPAGKNDDQVDALSLLSRMLGEMHAPAEKKAQLRLAERVEIAARPETMQSIFDRHFAARRRVANGD